MAPSLDLRFESCVVLDGDKTTPRWNAGAPWFESCVVLDGDKTKRRGDQHQSVFESCVVLDGDKTPLGVFIILK